MIQLKITGIFRNIKRVEKFTLFYLHFINYMLQ